MIASAKMPFEPTYVDHTPAVCGCCGKHAVGIGIGQFKRGDEDPRYLCGECVLIAEYIKQVRNWDAYETQAVHGGVDAAGPLVEQFGTDLSEWDEGQVRQFCATVWRGCADRLRELIRNGSAPF